MPRSLPSLDRPVGAGVLLLALVASCGKPSPDAFARFKTGETVERPGQAPRLSLRYAAPGPEAIPYVLTAERRKTQDGPVGLLRARVALGLSPRPEDQIGLQVRLLELMRLDPRPSAAPLDLAPEAVLLQATLDPRGALADVEDADGLPGPVNLALVAPLLLPRLPAAEVGAGAAWTVRTRQHWTRKRSGDQLTGQAPYRSLQESLLTIGYTLESLTPARDRAVITARAQLQLRGDTEALSHQVRVSGTAEATARWTVSLPGGLPDTAEITLKGSYRVVADGRHRDVTERITLGLSRER